MIYDVIGIGFGPANIALAVALEEEGFGGSCLFLERNAGAGWQEDMLLAGSDIQNHPLRDLVTPANPRSRYSFTNFLFEHDRLFEFLNLGVTYALRQEYAQYVRWVADAFSASVRYGVRVERLSAMGAGKPSHARYGVSTSGGDYQARSVVLAPGRSPNIPAPFKDLIGPRVFHLTQYKSRIQALAAQPGGIKSIAVIGASQSGVEIMLDLGNRFPDLQIHSVIRSYGFRLKDTSPFSDEIYFPEFVDYYFDATPSGKARLNEELRGTNYSSADGDVLHQLYLTRYEQRLGGRELLQVHQNADIQAVALDDQGITLALTNHINQQPKRLRVDAVVLATGFRNFGRGGKEELIHPLLQDIADDLCVDPQLGIGVNRDYSAQTTERLHQAPLFLNGLCESTHGFGDAGSFSLLSLRSREIAKGLKTALRVQREEGLLHA
jgi:L-ornithine N5-monooxygenase